MSIGATMRGTISRINPRRGMFAIQTDSGDFSVFENIGNEEFEIGDEVSWRNDTGMGSEQLTNHTKNRTCDVYFQNHWVSKSNLGNQLLET